MGRTTPEGRVKDAIVSAIKEVNGWYYTPIASALARAGVPDIICVVRGKTLFVEAKARGGKPTKLQEYEHAQIRAAGGHVVVVGPDELPAFAALLSAISIGVDP